MSSNNLKNLAVCLTSVIPCCIMAAKGLLEMSDMDNRKIMAENIRRHMEQKGVKAKDVCDALGIPMPTFSDWINGKTYPRIDKIEKMAAYFGVSKSALVEVPGTNSGDAEIKAALWGGDRELTAEDIDVLWEDVRDYVKFKTEQRKRSK